MEIKFPDLGRFLINLEQPEVNQFLQYKWSLRGP